MMHIRTRSNIHTSALHCFKLTVCICLTFFLNKINAQTINETVLLEDANIKLELLLADSASIAEREWLGFRLSNKSNSNINIVQLEYSINTITEAPDGSSTIIEGAFGKGNKYNLLEYYHDAEDMIMADRKFKFNAGQSLEFFKYPSNKAAISITSDNNKTEEICALIELTINYKINQTSTDLYTEDVMCTQWTRMDQVDISKLKDRFEFAIEDSHIQEQQVSFISLLTDLKPVLSVIDEEKIVDGIIARKNIKNSKERLLLLRALQIKKATDNQRLMQHYKSCMLDSDCQWEDDLQFYWDNTLLEPLLNSKLYVNSIASILELHSENWSDDPVTQQQIFDFLQSKFNINLEAPIDEVNFKDWYRNIKYLATSRHPSLYPYLKSLLGDERFFPVQDWSQIGSRKIIKESDRDKAKTIYIRVCDVAFVAMLRYTNEIKYTNAFVRKKVKPTLFIDPKWEGENPLAENAIQLKNPYTVLSPNLKLAEKYYYICAANGEHLKKLLEEHDQ